VEYWDAARQGDCGTHPRSKGATGKTVGEGRKKPNFFAEKKKNVPKFGEGKEGKHPSRRSMVEVGEHRRHYLGQKDLGRREKRTEGGRK